jgi:hypothetical protein
MVVFQDRLGTIFFERKIARAAYHAIITAAIITTTAVAFLKLGCGIWSTEEAADFLEANVPMDPATALEDAEMYLTCSDQQA